MEYTNIRVLENNNILHVVFNRPAHNNSINEELLSELTYVLDQVESNSEYKMIILEGQNGVFCTGMDFNEAIKDKDNEKRQMKIYMDILRKLSLIPKIVVSKISGRVMAGGVGFVAASDYVISNHSAVFTLSEMLWGLLPACVIPYLIRRIGFQPAYRMTFTTSPFTSEEAYRIGLIDEISVNLEDDIRKLFLKVNRLDISTIKNFKEYFRKMWFINKELENTAVAEITKLTSDPVVLRNIENFVLFKQFPWEKRGK